MVSNVVYFHPYFDFDYCNIIQMGWNHQLDRGCSPFTKVPAGHPGRWAPWLDSAQTMRQIQSKNMATKSMAILKVGTLTWGTGICLAILLMEEIRLTSWYGRYPILQGFIHPWWCRISSINSIAGFQIPKLNWEMIEMHGVKTRLSS